MKIEQAIVRPSRIGMTLHERDVRIGECYDTMNNGIHKRLGNNYARWLDDHWVDMTLPLWVCNNESGAFYHTVKIVKDPSI